MPCFTRPFIFSMWFVILLALAACGRDQPRLAPLDEEDVILAFGDSLTHGTGAGEDQSYPAVLEDLIGRRVVNEGVPGERSDQGLARLPHVLEEHRPRLMLLCYGGNDFLQKTGDDKAARNVAKMIELARGQGVEVVLLGVPKPGFLLSSAEFYQEIAERFNLAYEGDALPEILGDNQLKSDPVHPNAEGYRQLAGEVAQLLRETGAIPE